MVQCKCSPNSSSRIWRKIRSFLYFEIFCPSCFTFLALHKYQMKSIKQSTWSNVSITPGPFSTHPSTHSVSLPSMHHNSIHGKGLFMVKDQHPESVKVTTASVLPGWLGAFRYSLNLDPLSDSNLQGIGLRLNSFSSRLTTRTISKTLDSLHAPFPCALVAYYPNFSAASLNHLRVLYDILYDTFSTYSLAATESVPTTSEDENIELPHLLCPVIDFIVAVVRGGKAHDWLAVLDVFSSVLVLVQMTDDDVMPSLPSQLVRSKRGQRTRIFLLLRRTAWVVSQSEESE